MRHKQSCVRHEKEETETLKLNRKEILASAHRNFTRYFWIYISAAAILFIASGIDEYTDVIAGVQNLILSVKKGIFNAEQITDINSELWSLMLSGGGLGFFGIVISLFAANPLRVGVAGLFLKGINEAPEIKTIFNVFKQRYMNIVGVTIVAELVVEILTVAISLVYSFALAVPIGVVSVAAGVAGRNVFIAACVLLILVAIGITALYLMWLMNMRYNFYFVSYILSENPSFNFSAAYITSKRLACGRKLEIFKTELAVLAGKALALLVPYTLFAIGIFMTLCDRNGLDFIFAAVLSLVPCACLDIYLSAYREAIRARIYRAINIGIAM